MIQILLSARHVIQRATRLNKLTSLYGRLVFGDDGFVLMNRLKKTITCFFLSLRLIQSFLSVNEIYLIGRRCRPLPREQESGRQTTIWPPGCCEHPASDRFDGE